MPTLETYRSGDRAALLAIFDGNTPRFFDPHERELFAAFLDRPRGDFRVLRDDERTIIGCGGVMVDEDGTASMVWGMIAPPHQGTGFGWWMALERLSWIAAMTEARRVIMDTSQETAGFYVKLGFRTVSVRPDGYGPGLHRHDLEMPVDDAFRKRFGAGASGTGATGTGVTGAGATGTGVSGTGVTGGRLERPFPEATPPEPRSTHA